VCDAWRAMNEPRCYRAPLGHEAALAELWAHAGTQFDAEVVKVLVQLLSAAESDEPVLHRPPAAERA
jgi:HD-GYP domain-containing protein (c-di-GMP phosphodiesterase class II)